MPLYADDAPACCAFHRLGDLVQIPAYHPEIGPGIPDGLMMQAVDPQQRPPAYLCQQRIVGSL